MTSMHRSAKFVLSELTHQTPEALFDSFTHAMFDGYEDGTPANNIDEYNSANERLTFLLSLYPREWVDTQWKKMHETARAKGFLKKKAPEGMPQWEFDLLGGQ